MRFALAVAMLVGLASAAEAATIVKGSFEAGSFRGLAREGSGRAAPAKVAGLAAAPGWTIFGAGPADIVARGWAASDSVNGYDFVTVRQNQLVRFSNLSPDGFGVVIDDVQLSAVPDVTNWGLLLAGFGLVGALARRRRDTRSVSA